MVPGGVITGYPCQSTDPDSMLTVPINGVLVVPSAGLSVLNGVWRHQPRSGIDFMQTTPFRCRPQRMVISFAEIPDVAVLETAVIWY